MDMAISLGVDGTAHHVVVDTRTTLLDTLRDRLGVTSPKKGCDHGQCGACTVLVGGRRILSCLTLAATVDGAGITTAAGLADGDTPHPVQRAFLDHDAFQCGYCTPGQICSAVGVLDELAAGWPSHVTEDLTATPTPSRAEISERMAGNLCRCAAYPNIVSAIEEVAEAETGAETGAEVTR
jgi:xanthine dehydrogenase YagT iron-sulfur-binding subunit